VAHNGVGVPKSETKEMLCIGQETFATNKLANSGRWVVRVGGKKKGERAGTTILKNFFWKVFKGGKKTWQRKKKFFRQTGVHKGGDSPTLKL